jgi:hypothetical protein
MMTMMTTIIAVALGLMPAQPNGEVNMPTAEQARMIGRYSETTDDTGTTHLMGSDRMSGKLFHLTVNPFGRVEGTVGDQVVSFRVNPVI